MSTSPVGSVGKVNLVSPKTPSRMSSLGKSSVTGGNSLRGILYETEGMNFGYALRTSWRESEIFWALPAKRRMSSSSKLYWGSETLNRRLVDRRWGICTSLSVILSLYFGSVLRCRSVVGEIKCWYDWHPYIWWLLTAFKTHSFSSTFQTVTKYSDKYQIVNSQMKCNTITSNTGRDAIAAWRW